ncbi:hypothetical protein MRB53_004748 [Persea americana]|uniref:Uncharacterized protein n=1 Tax=Persea americana TaxID=3435 RepID=A0ACC2MBF3_PERAE|nr:hypothetical protein MRB53_004748 [Persea americana]
MHAYCSCKKFEFEGIPCRHVLSIMVRLNIRYLPERYILKRWMKGVTKVNSIDNDGVDSGSHDSDSLMARHRYISGWLIMIQTKYKTTTIQVQKALILKCLDNKLVLVSLGSGALDQLAGGYLAEGHLTVEPEPPPSSWLVAQNLLTALEAAQQQNTVVESSQGWGENSNTSGSSTGVNAPVILQQLINSMQEMKSYNMADHEDNVNSRRKG